MQWSTEPLAQKLRQLPPHPHLTCIPPNYPCLAAFAEKQQEMEEADWLMNSAAAGEASWDDIRAAVADRYAAAGLREVADFIRAA